MKKLLILSLFLLLTACKTTVDTTKQMPFPNVPEELQQACPDLATVDPKTDKLSDVLTVVTDNYSTYYECKVKVDAWIEWYNTQKTITDGVK